MSEHIPVPSEREWTDEEREEFYAGKQIAAGIASVFHDAKEKGFKTGNGGQSSFKCTICPNGTVRYSVASVNGHIWAACSTPGCLRFLQ